MGFMIQCDNKKCGEFQESLLDKETNEVYCASCDRPIKHVSIFTKRQMRAMGQIKRASVPKQAFSVKCANAECQKIQCPQLLEEEGKKARLMCPVCGVEHSHLSPPYAQTVISF